MKQKSEKPMYWRPLLLAVALLGVLSACSGGGGGGTPEPLPEPEPDPEPEVTTGTVSFAPDWGGLSVPTSLRYHFYPAAGSVVTRDVDGNSFNVTLENGTYRMLAYNTDATGVTYENTDDYAAACVRVAPVEVPATRAASILMQPSSLLVLSQESMAVEKGGTLSVAPSVRALTSTVNLTFEIANASFVESLAGSMNGLLPSLLLSTGLPDAAAVSAAQDCFMVYEVSMEEGRGTASFTTLGMADPLKGEAYSCLLVLNAVTTDGQEWETVANLSNVITQVLEYNDGSFPTDEPVNLKISVNATTAGMQAEVKSWSIGGKGDVTLKPAE